MVETLSLEAQIVLVLRRIARAIGLRSRSLLHDFGLTAPQLTTLYAIARLQPVTASAVAAEVHLGRPTVTGILNRLESRGLVHRVRGYQDRRSVYVSLTERGQQVLDSAPPLLQDEFLKELAKLKEWERTQILATLQRVAEMMEITRMETIPILSDELADEEAADLGSYLEAAGDPAVRPAPERTQAGTGDPRPTNDPDDGGTRNGE